MIIIMIVSAFTLAFVSTSAPIRHFLLITSIPSLDMGAFLTEEIVESYELEKVATDTAYKRLIFLQILMAGFSLSLIYGLASLNERLFLIGLIFSIQPTLYIGGMLGAAEANRELFKDYELYKDEIAMMNIEFVLDVYKSALPNQNVNIEDVDMKLVETDYRNISRENFVLMITEKYKLARAQDENVDIDELISVEIHNYNDDLLRNMPKGLIYIEA